MSSTSTKDEHNPVQKDNKQKGRNLLLSSSKEVDHVSLLQEVEVVLDEKKQVD